MKKIYLFVIMFLLITPSYVLAFEKQVKTGNAKIDDFSQKTYDLYYDVEKIETKLRNANVMMIWVLTDPEEFKIKLQGVEEDDIDNLINEKITNLPNEISFSSDDFKNLLNLTYYDILKTSVDGINDGIVNLPDEMNSLKNQVQELIALAGSLPNEAKSLGFKAPKALKAINANVEVLKETAEKIPNLITEATNTINIMVSFLSQESLTITLNEKYIKLGNAEIVNNKSTKQQNTKDNSEELSKEEIVTISAWTTGFIVLIAIIIFSTNH